MNACKLRAQVHSQRNEISNDFRRLESIQSHALSPNRAQNPILDEEEEEVKEEQHQSNFSISRRQVSENQDHSQVTIQNQDEERSELNQFEQDDIILRQFRHCTIKEQLNWFLIYIGIYAVAGFTIALRIHYYNEDTFEYCLIIPS